MSFQWIPFLTYAVITAITPGPNNIMSMTNGNRKGFHRALPFNFGILTGFFFVLTLCTLFCGALSQWIPKLKMPMLIIGAAYILWLAWETFRSDGTIDESNSKDGFIAGMLLQFINPKFYLYCIMSLEAYILPVYHGELLMVLLFDLILALIAFFCTLLWSAFGAAFRKLFSEHTKVVNTILALLLVYCAITLFIP
ncbi:MAG: LysE family transporter [Firmicutes bacterium]|nr:LysE family transporter [Bacillota bacterium]